ncbi:MAG: hypothetical protein GHCLOJNM_04305 [bacterium]|nr:hypothetical protein [bacterium]
MGQSIDLDWEEVASGFSLPLLVTHAGDGSNRLFVVQQRGRIRIIDSSGSVLPTDFLNLGSTGLNRVSQSGSERGLLGLAFHPDYETNGRFFVNYTLNSPAPSLDGDTIVAEYTVSANPNVANTTERIILGPIDQPFSNHNGGHLTFGPDGFLYIGLGDGGSGGDPGNRAQDLNTLLGKMLRIDVDATSPPLEYGIPADNPFIGATPGLDEIYAYGLRNPWRYSFDRLDGRLFCADVGQNLYEEVSLIENGDNLGWRIMEGLHCFSPSVNCPTAGLVLPITEYGRDQGSSVTGGYVYRGVENPDLYGLYFFGDFGSGRIWTLAQDPPGTWNRVERRDSPFSISSFGEDENGELYFAYYGGGVVYHLYDNPITFTPTFTPTSTRTATPSFTRTVTRTPTATRTVTLTRTPTGTFTVTHTFTVTPTVTDSPTISETRTPSNSATVTQTPTPSPTVTETVTPTQTFTPEPVSSLRVF